MADYSAMTVAELQEVAAERSLSVSGTKAELIARLQSNDEERDEEAEALAEAEEAEAEQAEAEAELEEAEDDDMVVVQEGVRVPKPQEGPAGEPYPPLIIQGMWVRLAGQDPVPEPYWGALASVVYAQVFEGDGSGPDALSPRPYQYQTDDATFLVQTRGVGSATLELTRASFLEVASHRGELEGHG